MSMPARCDEWFVSYMWFYIRDVSVRGARFGVGSCALYPVRGYFDLRDDVSLIVRLAPSSPSCVPYWVRVINASKYEKILYLNSLSQLSGLPPRV
jgi:hypothetical protein